MPTREEQEQQQAAPQNFGIAGPRPQSQGFFYDAGQAVGRIGRGFSSAADDVVGGIGMSAGLIRDSATNFKRGALGEQPVGSERARLPSQPPQIPPTASPIQPETARRPIQTPDMNRPQLPGGVSQYGGNTGLFVNNSPQQGFGQAIYSDSVAGTQGIGTQGIRSIDSQGQTQSGPFGRTDAEQEKIRQRVGQYERAIGLLRSTRALGAPSARDRLQSRATQRISLDQGLGGFLNQASDRNFAREQLGAFDERAGEQAKLQADQQQQGIENAFEAERINQGRFRLQSVTTGYDPLGREIEGIRLLDTRTGTVSDPSQGLQPDLPESEIRKMVEAEADEASGGLANLFTSDKDIFGGLSKEDWINSEVQKRLQKQDARGSLDSRAPKEVLKNVTDEDIRETAKKNGVTEDQVREWLEGRS